jgi:hypothetical protein
VNAVERLWRGFQGRDWAAARRQLHPGAQISWPHTGELLGVEEYLTARRLQPGEHIVQVHAITGHAEDRPIAVRATVHSDDGTWHVGGFYDLQVARISGGVELWVAEGRAAIPDWRR